MPFSRNPFFTAREDVLAALHEALQKGEAALSQPPAISGLGGIGKTQTAVEYAYRYQHEYEAILWVTAENETTLSVSYANIASILNLQEKDAPEFEKVVAAVKAWLQKNNKYLLVLDNADDLRMVHRYLPVNCSGRILFTTRSAVAGRRTQLLSLSKFSLVESVELITKRSGIAILEDSIERQDAISICQELDGLPLALEQAGAYIEANFLNFNEYLRLYKAEGIRLFAKHAGPDEPEHLPVTVTFSLALRRLEEDEPIAVKLLRLLSFLAPDNIPEFIFTSHLYVLNDGLNITENVELSWVEIVGALAAGSIIQRDRKQGTLSIHRLVQAVLRSELHVSERQACVIKLVWCVLDEYPVAEFSDWERCEQLLAHSVTLFDWCKILEVEADGVIRLLTRSGLYLMERAQYKDAEGMYAQALEMCERVFVSLHPTRAIALNNLAGLYEQQGRFFEAEKLHLKAIDMCMDIFGSEHELTAKSMSNLAGVFVKQGKLTKAEEFHKKAFGIRERLLGLQHEETATSIEHLAFVYGLQARFSESEPLYMSALEIRRKVSGERHPDTANVLNNLAGMYESQGRYGEAEPLYVQALNIRKSVLGEEHPLTALSLNDLAFTYARLERFDEALPLYQEALAIRERFLGPNHYETAQTLNNIASLYLQMGKTAGVELLFDRALKIFTSTFGEQNLETANALSNLAGVRRSLGNWLNVETMLCRALDIRKAILGDEHPDTAGSMNNLGSFYLDQGKHTLAQPLLEKAYAITKRVYGDSHRSTQIIAINLTNLRIATRNSPREQNRAARRAAKKRK